MTNYNVVSIFADNIRTEIRAGRMPPWHADPIYGAFTNDFSLNPDDAAKLVQGVDDGAQRGTGPDPLAGEITTTNYPFAWPTNLGPPDVIYRIPVQNIPATGIVRSVNEMLMDPNLRLRSKTTGIPSEAEVRPA